MVLTRTENSMPNSNLKQRLAVRRLLASNARRAVATSVLNSKALRWRYGASNADDLLIVPPNLRTADSSFVKEYREGYFGLGGVPMSLDGQSPFSVVSPNVTWARELHGFQWLRHFAACDDVDAPELARKLLLEWVRLRSRDREQEPCWAPDVIGRRLVSWLSFSTFLLEGVDAKTYDLVTRSLGRQLVTLNATWRKAPAGMPRLSALISLLICSLCIKGQDRRLQRTEKFYIEQLNKFVYADGGPIDRDVASVVDLLLEFLPLERCYAARGVKQSEVLAEVRNNLFRFVQLMRLGDGNLCRFNGSGVPQDASLATVLAYDDSDRTQRSGGYAQQSGYACLADDKMVVVVDVGSAPDLEYATVSQAGCLSFEFCVGRQPVFVNRGMPGPAFADWMSVARATASHNTLCLGETSSARLVMHPQLMALVDGIPLSGPSTVACSLKSRQGAQILDAHHDGYLERFGVLHHRELILSADGKSFAGVDRLAAPDGDMRLKQDVPFAIHFHLHPSVEILPGKELNTVRLTLSDESTWLFRCDGAAVGVEESLFFADSSAPMETLQITIRGATFGESVVRWSIERE